MAVALVAKLNSPHFRIHMERCGNHLIIWTRPVFCSFCSVEVNYEGGSQWWQLGPACRQAESRVAHENRPERNLIFSFHICFLLLTLDPMNQTSFRSRWMFCFELVLCSEALKEFLKGITTVCREHAGLSKKWKRWLTFKTWFTVQTSAATFVL